MTGPLLAFPRGAVVLVLRDGVVRVTQAPETSWCTAALIDGQPQQGIEVADTGAGRFVTFGDHGAPGGRVSYRIGEHRAENGGMYLLTRIA